MKKVKFEIQEAEICFIGLAYMFINSEARAHYKEYVMEYEIEYPNEELNIISDLILNYEGNENMLLDFETIKKLKEIERIEQIRKHSEDFFVDFYYERFKSKLHGNIDKCVNIPLIEYADSKKAFIAYINGNFRALINSNDEYKYVEWNGKAWNKLTEEESGLVYGRFIDKCESELKELSFNCDEKKYAEQQKKINLWDSKSKFKECLDKIKRDKNRIINIKIHDQRENIICSKNGLIINFSTGEIKESTRNDLILNTSKYNLLGREESKKFMTDKLKVYLDVLGNVRLGFILNLIAYKMLGKNLQLAIFMIGAGATGKSTFKNIIKDLFENNISNIPYEYFTVNHRGNDDKSRDDLLVSLDNKLWGVASEGEEDYIISQAKFKTILSNSSETARPTRGNLIDINLQKLDLLIDTNNIPKFANFDDAVNRRLLFVKFINKIPLEKRNANFYREQIKPNFDYVFSYFVYRAIDILNNGFEIPDIIKNDTKDNILEMDSLLKFVSEKVLPVESATMDCEEIERMYCKLCEDENMVNVIPENIRNTAKAYNFIVNRLKEYTGFENISRERVSNGRLGKKYVIKGICLREEIKV